ncbi:MAG: energy transducer TonB [Bdellovibrionales bacterium]
MDLKKILNIGIAFIAVPVIFLGVGHIIAEPPGNSDGKDRADLSFLRNIRPSELNERERVKPKTPPKVQKQPDVPKPKVAKVNKPQNANPQMAAVPLALGLDLGSGPFVGGVGASGNTDSDIVPIVKVEAQYPREAAMKGIEGYVQLNVDIQKDGSVSNVRVVNSNPRRVFDRNAVRAAGKYKYRPQIKDGKPTVVKNWGIQINFKL